MEYGEAKKGREGSGGNFKCGHLNLVTLGYGNVFFFNLQIDHT